MGRWGVTRGGGFKNLWCHAFVKSFYRTKQCLSYAYLLVSDKMPSDSQISDTVGRWLLWLKLFFHCQLLHVNCKMMFEMIMMMNGCIYTYTFLFVGKWITSDCFGNYCATFGKTHAVEGGILACNIFLIGGWPCVTQRRGVKFRLKSVTYFFNGPISLTNSWKCHKILKPGVNLWSRALISNHPTGEKTHMRHLFVCIDSEHWAYIVVSLNEFLQRF